MLPAAGSVTPQTAARRRSTIARSAMRAHARTEVASACRACGEDVDARRSTRRFCSSPCRQRAYRAGRRPILAPVAHQRRIREREAAREPPPRNGDRSKAARSPQFPFAEAKALIVRYEWLGTMPTGPRACYGLRTPDRRACGRRLLRGRPCARKRRPVRPRASRPRYLPGARRLRPLGAPARRLVH